MFIKRDLSMSDCTPHRLKQKGSNSSRDTVCIFFCLNHRNKAAGRYSFSDAVWLKIPPFTVWNKGKRLGGWHFQCWGSRLFFTYWHMEDFWLRWKGRNYTVSPAHHANKLQKGTGTKKSYSLRSSFPHSQCFMSLLRSKKTKSRIISNPRKV